MSSSSKLSIVIIGGGAAGFFAAINAAEAAPNATITILERGKAVLQKVKISGGGRCNVTHACFVPKDLVKFYPRGSKELLGPFNRFCTGDTMEWFERHGVRLKIEDDGRVFPVSDDSKSIVDCLWKTAKNLGINVETQSRVEAIVPPAVNQGAWLIQIADRPPLFADKLLIATGSNLRIWEQLARLGHTIVPPVPSLFTFNIQDKRLEGLAGVSVPFANITIKSAKINTSGALLITHWGMSGPAILKLSAWGARQLHDLQYQFPIQINWLGNTGLEDTKENLEFFKSENPKKKVVTHPLFDLPTRLWQRLVLSVQIDETTQWANVSKKQLQLLAETLTNASFQVKGKSTFKEEFVTAGGVELKEIDFKKMESKLLPNLFFAGEVLDIDAVTGGFNFQAAWTGGWIAATAMVQ